jgi:CheY-like chemotaxis protein
MPDANTNPAGLNRTTTILLAEDDEDDILLIESAFKEASISYHLVVVKDGQRATEYLKGEGPYADRARYPMPFLLLLDLKMPIMNGFEVLKWIRSQPNLDRLLVVILSSSQISTDLSEARQLGTNCYLVKSSDYKQLVLLLKSFDPVESG